MQKLAQDDESYYWHTFNWKKEQNRRQKFGTIRWQVSDIF